MGCLPLRPPRDVPPGEAREPQSIKAFALRIKGLTTRANLSLDRLSLCLQGDTLNWRKSNHDPQTAIGRVPPVLAETESGDRQAPQPRHVQDARGGAGTRA